MANNIVFSRVDSRLIHGQVATKWTVQFSTTKILLVDEASARDEFLSRMLIAVAPPGTTVIVVTPQKAAELFKEEKLNDGRYFVLFKDVRNVQDAYDAGLKLEQLNIGNLPKGMGTKAVLRSISLTEEDAKMLKHCAQGGMEIFFQIYPGDKSAALEQVLEKYFPGV